MNQPGLAFKTNKTIKVIFLDIDGVLNNENWIRGNRANYINSPCDPQAVAVLNKLVEDTGASIVMSSTWRRDGIMACRGYLVKAGFKYPEKVIGRTSCMNLTRGQEIFDWIIWCPYHIESYVILDDDAFDMEHQIKKLVHVDYRLGLTADILPAILKHL